MLLCLGLDYRRGGFVDRALEAFKEVLQLDPDEPLRAGRTSRSCYEDQHQWAEAYATRQQLARRRRRAGRQPRPPDEILAFLENEIGQAGAAAQATTREAARRFEAAIERDPRNAPAYLNLGDVRLPAGRRRRRDRDVGAAGRRRRPSAPTSRSPGSRARTPRLGSAGALRRRSAAG